MAFVHSIWNALLTGWIRIGTALFPRTIHPMIVHFPIALLYIAIFIQVVGYIFGYIRTPLFQRTGYWMLTLSLFSLVAAAMAGILAEQYVRWTPTTAAILSAHQRDAVITGVLALAAWVVRMFTRYPESEQGDKRTFFPRRRGRSTPLSDILLLGAVIMVSVTGSLGGSMVYNYGVGTPATLVKHLSSTPVGLSAAAPVGGIIVDKWLSYSAATKTVDIVLDAGVDDGYNFNGYANGAMKITVPLGWKVDVSFFNASTSYNHSAMVVPISQIKAQSNMTPAFAGASLPHPVQGLSPGAKGSFSFVAARAGHYGIACDVPGHMELGMWDAFNISATAPAPSIVL
jgi:uncharacterized membrane protein/uncharacterized cupredoxin-like copper-binding protein